jgi:RNA polymerase sigma factor (sigma-70 family)
MFWFAAGAALRNGLQTGGLAMEEIDLGTEAGQNALALEIHVLAHRHAARLLKPRCDAEDAAQDVVLWCLGELRKQRWDIGDRTLDAHICCLVRRRIAVLKRQRRRWMERDREYLRDLESSVHGWMDPEASFDATEVESARDEALGQLPPACRASFDLVRTENLSYESAAERLGVTTAAVKANVLRAQRTFRSVLERKGIEAPRRRRAAADK